MECDDFATFRAYPKTQSRLMQLSISLYVGNTQYKIRTCDPIRVKDVLYH